jgi:nitrilase
MQRVAVVQAGSSLFDTPATLDRMQAHCEAVEREGASVVVFPEAYVGGYPKGLTFGAVVGSRDAPGRELYRRYWASAIEIPGPEVARMGAFAAEMRAHLVVGVIERAGGTLYCTALIFAPDGQLAGQHRKLMPTASERLIWGMGDGSTMPVIDSPAGRIGTAICWENYMPMLRQSYYAKGVGLWCAPTVDSRDVWQSTMRHIACEGRSFVLSACQYLTHAHLPPDYPVALSDAEPVIRGGSVIIGPLGDVLAGPIYDREAILVADIDPQETVRAKFDLDVAGHYGRPDIFTLKVDTTPRPGVAFTEMTPPSEEDGI